MIVIQENNTQIVNQEKASIPFLIQSINEQKDKWVNDNVIVVLLNKNIQNTKNINDFLLLTKYFESKNKSFVIVATVENQETASDELIIVPTLQEAKDYIEMEEISRDLGL